MLANAKKLVLVVEDDPAIIQELLEPIFERYSEEIECAFANDAGEALRSWDSKPRPDACVLDIMMPYGDAQSKLQGQTNPDEDDTGVRLLEYFRAQEQTQEGLASWIAVITARGGVQVGRRCEALLRGRGKLYRKPFDTIRFEWDLTKALGIACTLPRVLIEEYESEPAGSEPK